MITLARFLVILGLVLLISGGLLYLAARINLPLGRLPGDIRIEQGNFTCIFPLVTSILLSVGLTLLLNLVFRWLGRK